MADPSKPQTGFTFANTTTAGSSGSIFGQTPSSGSMAPPSSLFGGTTNNAPTSSLFGGQGEKKEGSSVFGGASKPNQGSSLFGGGSNTNQGASLFGGGASNTNQGSSVFGTTGSNAKQSSSVFGANASKDSGTGNQSPGFSFGQNKQQPQTSGASQTPSMFGGGTSGGSTLFGNAPTTTSAPSLFGAQTPTSKPTGGFSLAGNPSTTPAGPPPSNPLSFGSQKPPEQIGGAFSLSQAKSSGTDQTPTAAPSSSLFGGSQQSGGLFKTNQPSTSNANTSTSASTPSLFGGNLGGNTGGSLFGNLQSPSTTQPPTSATTSAPQQSQSEAPKSLFSNLGQQSAAPSISGQSSAPSLFSPTSQSSDAQKPASSFSLAPPKPTETSTPASSAPSLFSNLGAQKSTSAISPAPALAQTSGSSLFGNVGKAPEKPSETKDSAATSATTAPHPLASAAPLSLGGMGSKLGAATSTDQAPTKKTPDAASTTAANLGTSTAGPAPTAQSRLKNRSMDEIITRWATDLSKYQKEFQKQAEKIARWDRMLVENSDRIQKLYGSTLEAQRATSEVEKQLTYVENEQSELEAYLDRYEKQVDDMIQAQGGQNEPVQGPDKERQDTYDLAERLTERLDEMGQDLKSMIEEINDASSSLNRNNKPDDPLSQVVRVLNSHLTQLQQIDQGTAALQQKVAAAQKASQGYGLSNWYNGPTSDAADGFYRSYMGRR